MPGPDRNLFRPEALEHLSSPDNLERLMPVVRPMDWLLIVVTALLLGCVIVWSLAGRVPAVATGRGVILKARTLTVEDDAPDAGLISVSYFPARPGEKIKPGTTIQLTPDTVQQARYGAILATVTSVSPMPVTKEEAAGTIGNAEVVQNVMPEDGFIEVRARLATDPSTVSGYKWSS